MKRNITLLVLLLAMLMLVACGSQEPAADNNAANFEDVDGKLVALDTESKVFESPAVKVTIDKDAKTVTFEPADADGTTGADYHKFDLANNRLEKYHYVSMMGTGHYYDYDLANGELVAVLDNDRQDTTESAKQAGRFDSAVEKLNEEIAGLQQDFERLTGQTMEDYFK